MTILQFTAGQLPAQCSQIPLGIRAENDVTQVELDFSAWAEEYGAGVVQLLIRREGDAAPYPVLLSQSGSVAVWTVSATDLAVRGPLAAEWIYTVGTQIKKSEVLPFYVLRDIGAPGTAPDPYEDWLQQLTELAADAQAASLAIQDMDVEAETLAPGSAATVSKTVDPETGAVTLTFGIPRGQDGGGGGQQLIVHGTGTNSLISVNLDDPNTASGDSAIALGAGCEASALSAVAVGNKSVASAAGAISLGIKLNQRDPNRATGLGAVAIGASNESSGQYSVALGGVNTAGGNYALASGYLARAIGNASVALGRGVEALGRVATAIGDYVKATGAFSAVFGRFNAPDENTAHSDGRRKFAFIVGNGTDEEHRSNAATLDWNGNAAIAGKMTLGAGPSDNMDAATKKYVDDSIPTVPSASDATPNALGTAAAGSSESWARGDHVHPKPSAADIGAVAADQGSGNAGKWLKVGSDGAVTPDDLPIDPDAKTNAMTQKVGVDASGKLWTEPGSGGGGGGVTKVYDDTLTGNWHKIGVTAVDYATGVLTLEANDAPFTDDYSTSIRIAIVPLFEGQETPFQYGMMPPELWAVGWGSAYGVTVGTNQIKVYTGASTSVDSLTNTGNIDLTRWQIWAETSRNHAVSETDITGLDFSHRLRVHAFFPYGLLHTTGGVSIKKSTGTYGEGYNRGYAAITAACVQGHNNNASCMTPNVYETLSLRSANYAYTSNLYCKCPISFTFEIYPVSSGTWLCEGKILYAAWESNTPASTKKPKFMCFPFQIYLNKEPTSLIAVNGNTNSSLDGRHVVIYDMGAM